MDIQQKDKESLAAYIHSFKREAKRCNFTNNAATIRIVVKGLAAIAACVYEKGPQTLADAISEVEKLQAAQQLTATLLPSSAVNVLSNEGDQCFQCQELGHITCHCPNVHCLECNEYDHIAVDCPERIPPSGMPLCHKRQHSGIVPDQPLDTTTRTGTDIAGQDHSHTLMDIKVTVTIIHAEVIPDHITDAIIGPLHNTITPTLIIIAVTHHTGDHPHIVVYQLIPGITADPDHAHHINQVRTPHLNPHPGLAGQQ